MHKIYVDSYLIISNAVYLNLMKLNTKKTMYKYEKHWKQQKKENSKLSNSEYPDYSLYWIWRTLSVHRLKLHW